MTDDKQHMIVGVRERYLPVLYDMAREAEVPVTVLIESLVEAIVEDDAKAHGLGTNRNVHA